MSIAGKKSFEKAVQDAHIWLDEVMDRAGWDDKERAYRLLRATLHTLRDRLQVAEIADLAAQLPLIIRGLFFEGWQTKQKPSNLKTAEDFVWAVERTFDQDPNDDPREVTEAALAVIAGHVSPGEIEDIKSCLPPNMRKLWPTKHMI